MFSQAAKAALRDTPRDLRQLRNEWMIGIDDRKPAKSFTVNERSDLNS
jgi:predicted Zn-dependent protease with MMP-like domain